MEIQRITPLSGGASQNAVPASPKQTDGESLVNPKKIGKLSRMLRLFAEGARLQRFQAAMLGDSVLDATVSDLQRRHVIYFNRQIIKAPNRFGTLTPVKEYWLTGINFARARRICSLDMEDAI